MNGRIYDPLLGRFLSADVVVQAPGNLQSYNRYSYVMNNPVTYTDPTGFFWDPNSGFWGAKEWGIFGKAAVVDPAVEGFKSGSLHMEKGFTEIANAESALDVTIGVLEVVAGVGDGVGLVADYAPGGKQVKGTATLLAKNADEIADGASKLTKMLASKTDDAAGGVAKIERKLDDAAIDAKKVDVDPKTAPATEASNGQFRDTNGKLRESDGKFAPDGGPKAKSSNSTHGNTAGDQEAILYEKYDKDGNFEKHGVTQDLETRYSKKEIDEGRLVEVDRGPRREILKKERERVETNPGPKNRERWAGKRKKPNEED